MTQILATKLYIPRPRSNLVSRPRLIQQLNQGRDRKLTLLSAPAGFGKTTLLGDWVQSLDCPVAWISLDRGDNNPLRFLTYLAAALQTGDATIGRVALAMLQSSRPPSIEAVLTTLINEIAECSRPHILILDDYHLIDAKSVHEALNLLLDHSPPQLQLVISSRSDPPLRLSRLRGRNQLMELRTTDLRFRPNETTAFLNQAMGLALSAKDITALDARTEGWAVGLQMAALSIQSPFSAGEHDAERAANLVATFSGDHRYILDYFTDEVLLQQSGDIQSFLLQTAILGRLSGPLCDTVTRRNDGQEVLERLDTANLFIVPLDNERRWYRYHHLFADLLRKQLGRTQPELVPALHRLASQWYEENGLISEAVDHLLAAEDIEGAARVVEGNALAMMDHGKLVTLAGWLDDLPELAVRSRPMLCVAKAWPMAYAGQREAAELPLQDAEKALAGLDDGEKTDAERQRIKGHILAIRSSVLGIQGELSRAAELARRALQHLPDDDLMARGFAAHQLGFMLRMNGDLSAAERAFAQAIDISQAAGHSHVVMLVLCELATLLILRGKLHSGLGTCRDVIAQARAYEKERGQRLPVAGHAFIRMSTILREWNDLDAAERCARDGLAWCTQWGQADGLLEGHIHLSRVLQARGDWDGAHSAIQEATLVARHVSPWFESYTAARQARLWLIQGNMQAATRWAQTNDLRPDDGVSFQYAFDYLVLARLLIIQGRGQDGGAIDTALDLIMALLNLAETAGANSYVIEALILQALAFQAQGNDERALSPLERALGLAEPEGFVRIFVEEGAPMGRLLRMAIAQGIALNHAGRLLKVLESETKEPQARGPTGSSSLPSPDDPFSYLAEPLTERECQVLRLISAGLSNQEIAQELYVSINTIKTHTRNAYSKLNVRNRTQAVNRAKELGIL
jgi:LuxR family maltose regulon positive regulatory protein